jgi:hypothetical protein
MSHYPDPVFNKSTRKKYRHHCVWMLSAGLSTSMDQFFSHSFLSLEAGTWIRTASLALSAKENYFILHGYMCMSKKTPKMRKLK